jgi:hypothetical protein
MNANPSPPRWLSAGLCLIFLAVGLRYAGKVQGGDCETRSAFLRWRNQILELRQGVNIYERHNYPNPPIMALGLLPFALLPPVAGALAWFAVKAGLTLLTVHWTLQMVAVPGRPFPPWAMAAAVLVGLRPVLGDLTHGNVNLFVLFVVVAGLRAFTQSRDVLAGLLLALAIACKVTPALFLPYFAWKRAWRTLAGSAAGLGLFLVVVPSGFFGTRANAEMLVSWTRGMVVPYVAGGRVTTEHQNQSLPGVLFRLTTPGASFSEFHESGYVPVEYHNVVDLPPETVAWLAKGSVAALLGLAAWACRTPTRERTGWRLLAEFSVVFLGMLLFSERTWKHHYVGLLSPVAVLLYVLAAARPGRRLGIYLAGSLGLAVVLMTATETGLCEKAGKLAEVYGAYLAANLLLFASLMVLLHRGPRPAGDVKAVRVKIPGADRPAGRIPAPGARILQKKLDRPRNSL